MRFGSLCVHNTSAISEPMGAKHSHANTSLTSAASSYRFSRSHNAVQDALPPTRLSTGRVSSSYDAHSSYAHDERLRRTGRRKLVPRCKSHSDPGRTSESPLLRSRVQICDSANTTRVPVVDPKTNSSCCNKCSASGMEWDKYRPSAVVKDYAAVSTQNSKFRKHMEDECVAIPKFKAFHGDPAKSCFFGVYDGHGGSFCARYVAKNFHSRLSAVMAAKISTKLRDSELGSSFSVLTSSGSTECSESDADVLGVDDIDQCYNEAFATIDQELADYDESANCGSTAVTCLIRKYNGRTSFHIANLGDSRAILFANGSTSRLSVDHRATNEDEIKRIRARNGIILNKRVGGVLSVTRAFGQTDEKEFVTADPHTLSGDVKFNDSFLVLASDGVTDVFSDEEVTEFVLERLALGEKAITICKSLLDEAKAMGAMDNMTAVLICFSDMEEE